MANRVLVIDSADQQRFFFSVAGEILSIGDSPGQAEVVIRDLRIARIRCEIEFEEGTVVCEPPATTPAGSKRIARQELRPGENLQVEHAHLRLKGTAGDSAKGAAQIRAVEPPGPMPSPSSPTPIPSGSLDPAAVTPLFKRLVVFDGADRGRSFRLPVAGSLAVGNSGRHADIVLHDLYVSRVHCVVEVRDDKVIVSHSEGKNGTLINGQRLTQPQELCLGDVLRVGNSHFRLETAVPGDSSEEVTPKEEKGQEDNETVVPFKDTEGPSSASSARAAPEQAREPPARPLTPAGSRLLQLEGQVLGQYRIGPLLGRGHSGLVFRAQHLSTNLVVALKVLSADFPANGAELQRFVQALKVSSGIHHPNIVGVHGAGRNGSWCWIAREYVEGESLADLIARRKDTGKINWLRAAHLAVHLGRALGCLHQHKAVHGNITPQNVLVAESNRYAKLADLMLAQSLEGSKVQQAVVEQKLLAELPFMAPEQVDPDAFVDRLADLYAVGAVIYTLLTGQPPFVGATPEETIDLIRTSKPTRPSTVLRGMPAPFEAVIMKLLSRNQENRYQTAAELLADLAPIVQE